MRVALPGGPATPTQVQVVGLSQTAVGTGPRSRRSCGSGHTIMIAGRAALNLQAPEAARQACGGGRVDPKSAVGSLVERCLGTLITADVYGVRLFAQRQLEVQSADQVAVDSGSADRYGLSVVLKSRRRCLDSYSNSKDDADRDGVLNSPSARAAQSRGPT